MKKKLAIPEVEHTYVDFNAPQLPAWLWFLCAVVIGVIVYVISKVPNK